MSARKISTGLVLATILVAAGCSRGDAAADTTGADQSVLVGPENVVIVAAREIRTGPTLSGAIESFSPMPKSTSERFGKSASAFRLARLIFSNL